MVGKKGKLIENKENQTQFKVIFKTSNEITEIDINEKLHIPSIDILTIAKACNMMAENPSVHARWNVLSNTAAVEFDYEKMAFEVWTKAQSKHYREELIAETGKRVTDKMVEEAVMTDPEYLRRYRIVLNKKEDAANLKSIALGFGERGDRLVNILAMMKSEKSSPVVSRRHQSRVIDDEEADKNAFSDEDTKDETDDQT